MRNPADNYCDYPRMATVQELFSRQAAETPDAVAVVCGDASLTYRALNSQANRLARTLLAAGVRLETKVAIAMERSIQMVTAMLAVLKAGGSYLPLDPQAPLRRTLSILADAGAQVVLADQSQAVNLKADGLRVILPEEAVAVAPVPEDSKLLPATGPENVAYVMYTSGSTGIPKGVEVLHRGIVRLVKNTNYVEPNAFEVVGQIANPAFDAITFEVWGALLNGGRLVILPSEVVLSPQRFASAIRDNEITCMFLTASFFNVMAASVPDAFGTMRTLVVGGDAVDPGAARKILETAPPKRLVNGYGPTECTTFSVCHRIDQVKQEDKSIPIGYPIANSQAYILDEDLRIVANTVPGDLYLGGDGLARGYLNRPDLTTERFIPHPFSDKPGARLYKTGDRARYLNDDGLIDFLGRKDHQVKFRGFRIELGEIEVALRNYPGIVDAVVVVRQSSAEDKQLVAYVSGFSEKLFRESLLRQHLRQTLPDYMIPAHVVVLASLPLNRVGKVDREALPAPSERTAKNITSTPMNVLEKRIAETWRSILNLDQVGAEDNFFDLGGSSLTLALVENRLRTLTNYPFSITDLFRYPTIRTLARFLDGKSDGNSLLRDARRRADRQRTMLQTR